MKTIIFDVFGTLITQPGRRIDGYSRLFSAERLPFMTRNVDIEVFAEELGREHLLPLIKHELADEMAAFVLFNDVSATLRELRAEGWAIGLCSNLAKPYGAAVLALLPGLDAYVFSYEVGAKKPDPIIYQAACSAMNCRPGDVLFVGDSRKADFEGPRAFGMQARLIDRKGGQMLKDVLKGDSK